MKKLLLILAIGAFVACNDDGTTDGTSTDSSAITPSTVDTNTVTPIDTSNRAGDTTLNRPDTLRK